MCNVLYVTSLHYFLLFPFTVCLYYFVIGCFFNIILIHFSLKPPPAEITQWNLQKKEKEKRFIYIINFPGRLFSRFHLLTCNMLFGPHWIRQVNTILKNLEFETMPCPNHSTFFGLSWIDCWCEATHMAWLEFLEVRNGLVNMWLTYIWRLWNGLKGALSNWITLHICALCHFITVEMKEVCNFPHSSMQPFV